MKSKYIVCLTVGHILGLLISFCPSRAYAWYTETIGGIDWRYCLKVLPSYGEARLGSESANGSPSCIEEDNFVSGLLEMPSYMGGYPIVKISDYSFSNQKGVTKIILPTQLEVIGKLAFANLPLLESIEAPETLRYLDYGAFRDCTSLKKIVFHGNAPGDDGAYGNVPDSCVVYVEQGSTGWGVSIPGVWKGMKIVYLPCSHISVLSKPYESPTCEIDGHTAEYVCSKCGLILQKSEILPALEHQPYCSKSAVDPDCTTAGNTEEIKCSRCSAVLIQSIAIPAKGHKLYTSKDAVAPTCVDDGCTVEKTCSVCERVVYSSKVVPATGHRSVIGITKSYPTTEHEGLIEYYCEECAELISVKKTPKLPKKITWSSQVVNGVEFKYYISNDVCVINAEGKFEPAIPPETTGKLIVPSEIQGYPVCIVGENAFINCENLTEIILPNSITRLEPLCFFGCSNLKSITLSKSIRNISKQAFWGCKSLPELRVPSSVAIIEHAAFDVCKGLTNLYFYGDAPECDSRAFDENLPLHCVATVSSRASGWPAPRFPWWESLDVVFYDEKYCPVVSDDAQVKGFSDVGYEVIATTSSKVFIEIPKDCEEDYIKIRVLNHGYDITQCLEFPDISSGLKLDLNIDKLPIKGEIVSRIMDPAYGMSFFVNAADAGIHLVTSPTVPGLVYKLYSGSTVESLQDSGMSYVGDGAPWDVEASHLGTSYFISIIVTK